MKMNEPKVVTDVTEMLSRVAGESFLSKEYMIFEGDRHTELFDAFWNKNFNYYGIDKELIENMERCVELGDKIFNVRMFKSHIENKFYALKDTGKKAVWMEFKLYKSKA